MTQFARSLIATLALAALASAPALAQQRDTDTDTVRPEADAAPRKGDRVDRPQPAEPPGGTTAAERRAERLDRMFAELAAADTKERADRIARHIMRRMTRSGSPTVDLLMARAGYAMQTKNYGLALDLLDGVVRMKPDFAEGWNRRATVNFLAGDFGRSIADIEETLRREPRHWGALVGLSVILVSMERKETAVEVMDRALEIHPHLEDTRVRRDQFRQELEGTDT
ncbi:tetratricopeptide repeat protein [Acuticoccus sp.]|uniref:tetratricopeptide repeat protein n=1 Tax=Acuticoccus sp. TaxID=1904378 RepID=UPI003B529F62